MITSEFEIPDPRPGPAPKPCGDKLCGHSRGKHKHKHEQPEGRVSFSYGAWHDRVLPLYGLLSIRKQGGITMTTTNDLLEYAIKIAFVILLAIIVTQFIGLEVVAVVNKVAEAVQGAGR